MNTSAKSGCSVNSKFGVPAIYTISRGKDHLINVKYDIKSCLVIDGESNSTLQDLNVLLGWNGELSIFLFTSNIAYSLLDVPYHARLFYLQSDVEIGIENTIVTKRLPSPYVSQCTEGEGFENFFGANYDQESCFQSCFMREMFDRCGTVVDRWKPFMTADMLQGTKNMKTRDTQVCLAGILKKYLHLEIPKKCYCPVSCCETEYEYSSNSLYEMYRRHADYSNIKRVHIRHVNKRVTHVEEFPAYTVYELLSNLSGIVGVLMGMSIISIIEVFVYIYIVIKNKIRIVCR